ncbi:queuosine salvage protein [Exaiptasia diaphana]|uniref:Queuosine 5'-phosphate N-glycosylase/hydrolase n=1 Tax=Exaiptasia diaphana TaxID=2652724 RepID=A0A913X4E9_EXADI|nr:queuosine salvage protein [Exaiptasia diaphana]KXJ20652.1 UPF0553 protein [Exaiptasia diaphana]
MSPNDSVLCPLDSAKLISAHSKHVSICESGVLKTSELLFDSLKSKRYCIKVWKEHKLHPKKMNRETVDWIFLLDCLNFSFWVENDVPPWAVEFEGEVYHGYWALCAGINRALKEGIPITSPSFFAKVTSAQLQQIFRSETSTQMPLIDRRVEILNEAGKMINHNYHGSFAFMIEKCQNSALKLLQLITTSLKGFQDEGTFNNCRVSFYKRAQILIADIWACFEGKSWGQFDDIQVITMFADYKVPQALLYLGVLKYSQNLVEKLKRGDIIPPGDILELEIRGNSICSVDRIYQKVLSNAQNDDIFCEMKKQELAQCFNSVIIDFYLWDFAKEQVEKDVDHPPCHKTRTIFY